MSDRRKSQTHYDTAKQWVGEDYSHGIDEPTATLIYAILAVADAVNDLTAELAAERRAGARRARQPPAAGGARAGAATAPTRPGRPPRALPRRPAPRSACTGATSRRGSPCGSNPVEMLPQYTLNVMSVGGVAPVVNDPA